MVSGRREISRGDTVLGAESYITPGWVVVAPQSCPKRSISAFGCGAGEGGGTRASMLDVVVVKKEIWVYRGRVILTYMYPENNDHLVHHLTSAVNVKNRIQQRRSLR